MAKSGKAVETAGDIDTVLLDKTGTITMGNRHATDFLPVGKSSAQQVGRLAALASIADETPEGKTIVKLHFDRGGTPTDVTAPNGTGFVAFSAQTRMSGVDLPDGRQIRKGAPDAVVKFVQRQSGTIPSDLQSVVDSVGSQGATPLVVAEGANIVGVIVLSDVLKTGISERLERLRAMGVRSVMITGDNPLTAATIAKHAGVDDFVAQCTPESKLAYIRKEQADGKLVAMVGDGTNDAPALAQADVGLAMNSGTQAAKEAGNMVDLDSDPTKLIEVVEIGKQLLMTRGALTTFSVANDVAKYFAIIPGAICRYAAVAQSYGHYESSLDDFRYLVGGHLQRRDHSDPDSSSAEGRKVSAARRRRLAAQESDGMGSRWRYFALRRHQADRPGAHRDAHCGLTPLLVED